MPLSSPTVDAFQPRLEHLMTEIARVNELRHSSEGLSIGQSRDRTLISIDKNAEKALEDAFCFLAWTAGELPHMGIAKEHRRFLDPRDLALEEIEQILLTALPPQLQSAGFELITLLRRRELAHVLAGYPKDRDHYSSSDKTTNLPLNGAVRSIVTAEHAIHISNGSNDYSRLTHNVCYAPVAKTRVQPGQENFPNPNKGPHQLMFLRGCKIKRGNRYKQVSERNDGSTNTLSIDHDLNGNLVYGSTVELMELSMEDARLIDVSGSITSCSFKNTTILSGNNLQMSGGEWLGGGLEVGHQACSFAGQFFFGTNITLNNGFSSSKKSPCFKGCDFTYAHISDQDLPRIANTSDSACVFSGEQMKKIKTDGHNFLTSESACAGIRAIAPGEEASQLFRSREGSLGIGRAPRRMMVDHDDPKRSDIAGAPIIVKAGLDRTEYRFNRSESVADERLFTPLTGEHANLLPLRITFFKALAAFVHGKTMITEEAMLHFLITKGGVAACRVLDLGEGVLNFPGALFDLPSPCRGVSNGSRDSSTNFFYILKGFKKTANATLVHSSSLSPSQSSSWGPNVSPLFRDAEEEVHFDRYELTYYAALQALKGHLYDLCGRLIHYGRYLDALVSQHGYQWPQVVAADEPYSFENVFHPNLPATLAKKSPAPTLVHNTVVLPHTKSSILAITGPNGKAGKTTLMGGVAHALTQGQSGAPSPAAISIPSGGLYDHVLTMPNIRAQAGGNESGMESRARVVLEEFLERVKELKATPPARPTHVALCIDEVMMGVTNPDDGMVIECNFIEELMTIPGIQVTILLVSPDTRVLRSLQNRFSKQVNILAPTGDSTAEETYHLVPSDTPAVASPRLILTERGLNRFVDRKGWMIDAA